MGHLGVGEGISLDCFACLLDCLWPCLIVLFCSVFLSPHGDLLFSEGKQSGNRSGEEKNVKEKFGGVKGGINVDFKNVLSSKSYMGKHLKFWDMGFNSEKWVGIVRKKYCVVSIFQNNVWKLRNCIE